MRIGTRAGLALAVALVALGAPAAAGAAGRCGDHPWCDTGLSPAARADLLLHALTRDEKVSLLGGDELTGACGCYPGAHTGRSDGVPRVGLPPTFYSDGPVGPRSGKSTAMPAPIALAATFDRRLAYRHGTVVGNEVRLKGNDVVFAPTVNIMRTPLGGRTFEAYGEDPYLQARLAVEWIRAVQAQGVIANVKHFAVNNQEGQGVNVPGAPVGGAVQGNRLLVDAIVDERTLREIYLPQFEAAVKEGRAGSVMCAYNRIGGQYACENVHLLQEILRGEWGFDGFVLADYGAAHNTFASLSNGLDFEPWPALAYSPPLIDLALALRQSSDAAIDEHARAILRTLFAYGFFDRDAYPENDAAIDGAGHAREAAAIERAGIVMLRNRRALPLTGIRSLALIGKDSETFKSGGGSSDVEPLAVTTPRQGIERRAARAGVQVRYDPGDDPAKAAATARGADAAVVVVADAAGEGADKPCMDLDCGGPGGTDRDGLIEDVAAANPRTIVVLETAGPVLTPWRDKVAGLLEAWYPGEEGGTAIASVLFGDADPGGRLPATFPAREQDEPYAGDQEAYPGVSERVVYKEGVLVGYRWFDERRIAPAFPFGHGLSYTSFAYRDLRVRRRPGGRAVVTARVTNTGRRRGTDVAQLYLGLPDPAPGVVQPPRALRGFARVSLAPGRSKRVRFPLRRRDFAWWDAGAHAWRVAAGRYRIMVGRSSRDIRLRGRLTLR